MALTVETGASVVGADSYNSIAEIDAYALAHGCPSTWRDKTLGEKEDAARRAAQGLDLEFSMRWLGTKKVQEQGLDFPRVGIEDPIDGFVLSDTTVPKAVKDAHAELSMDIRAGKTIHDSHADGSRIIKERKKLASLEKEVTYESGRVSSPVANFPRIRKLLSRVTIGESGTVFRG